MTVRENLETALAGKPIKKPVYAAYDWFVNNRDIDWPSMFKFGLGQINHANLIKVERPNLQIVETKTEQAGQIRTDVKWVTDIGELHECFLGEWRQSYPIKSIEDYKIMTRAHSDSKISAANEDFEKSEKELGNKGITLGQLGDIPVQSRTPFQRIQIDFAGIERFFTDLADGLPQLMELLDLMNEQTLEMFRRALKTRAEQIKLWDNMSVDFMGPNTYRDYLVPMYKKIFNIVAGSGKKILVHYDGKLSLVADEIKKLPFDGLDSLTPPPEGDMTIKQARDAWPDKFFWMHPCLGWYHLPQNQLAENIRQMAKDAGPTKYCMMISEEVPHNWQQTIPTVLKTLDNL